MKRIIPRHIEDPPLYLDPKVDRYRALDVMVEHYREELSNEIRRLRFMTLWLFLRVVGARLAL